MLTRMWINGKTFHSLLVGMQIGKATLEDSLMFSCKTKYILHIIQRIVLLSIYPKELKTFHTKICTWMFISFIQIAKTWTQTRCLSVSKLINCGMYRQWNIIQCQKKWAIKPWENMVNLKSLLLSERSHLKVLHIDTIWFQLWHLEKGKTIESRSSVVVEGYGSRMMNRQSTEKTFRAVKPFYDSMVDTIVQSHMMDGTKNKPCKLGTLGDNDVSVC